MERTQILIVLNKLILALEFGRIKEVEQSPVKQEEWGENVIKKWRNRENKISGSNNKTYSEINTVHI